MSIARYILDIVKKRGIIRDIEVIFVNVSIFEEAV